MANIKIRKKKKKKKKTSAPWDTNVSKKADLNGNVRLVRLHSLSSRSHLQHQPTVYIWTFYYHHLWLWNNPSLTDLAQDFSPPRHPTNNRACDQNRLLLFLFFTCCHQIPQRRNKKAKRDLWCTNYRELPRPYINEWCIRSGAEDLTCAEIHIVDGLIVPPAAPSLIVMSPSVVMRVSEAAAGSQCV